MVLITDKCHLITHISKIIMYDKTGNQSATNMCNGVQPTTFIIETKDKKTERERGRNLSYSRTTTTTWVERKQWQALREITNGNIVVTSVSKLNAIDSANKSHSTSLSVSLSLSLSL